MQIRVYFHNFIEIMLYFGVLNTILSAVIYTDNSASCGHNNNNNYIYIYFCLWQII